jgi:hypothetical protein
MEHDQADYPGRGLRLMQSVQNVVQRIELFSRSGPIWPGLDDVRRVKVRRHPYLVVYVLHGDYLVIVAVAHTRKNPGYWVDRVDDPVPKPRTRSKQKPAPRKR